MFFFFSKRWSWVGVALLAGCSGEGRSDPPPPRLDASMMDVRIIDVPDSGPSPFDAWWASDGGSSGDAAPSAFCPTESCDPRLRVSCAMGMACVLGPDGRAGCAPEAGSTPDGMPCVTSAECMQGYACFDGPDGSAACRRICCAEEPESCGADLRCEPVDRLADGTPTAWGRCVHPRTCNVLDSEGTCEPGEGCYIIDADGSTQCRRSGGARQGETCMDPEDCEPGFFCGGLRVRICSRICALEGMPACPTDEGRCVAYAYSPEGTGTCTVAPM